MSLHNLQTGSQSRQPSVMGTERVSILVMFYLFNIVLPCFGNAFNVQEREWMHGSSAGATEGDVQCFSEYMELWIHRMRIEGLKLWLSGNLQIQVSLASLDYLNSQLSSCGFALHKDSDKNYIFRVMYSGCFVQLQNGNYVILLNLLRRIGRFGGRPTTYAMKCPVVPPPPNREHIRCDPDFIEVTRQIPVDSWNKELQWSLALRGNLVVALEDASLIQVNVEMKKPNITIQGRRKTVLSPVQVMETEGQFLPLKLVSGQYAYSMEATCPNDLASASSETVLHIFKRRMGLTKRGGYDNDTLSISSVAVNQTDTFSWSESTDFLKVTIPTYLIQQIKKCTGLEGEKLQQSYFRVDVVVTFRETNHKMYWTMENTLPCVDIPRPSVATNITSPPNSTSQNESFTMSMVSFSTPNFSSQTTAKNSVVSLVSEAQHATTGISQSSRAAQTAEPEVPPDQPSTKLQTPQVTNGTHNTTLFPLKHFPGSGSPEAEEQSNHQQSGTLDGANDTRIDIQMTTAFDGLSDALLDHHPMPGTNQDQRSSPHAIPAPSTSEGVMQKPSKTSISMLVRDGLPITVGTNVYFTTEGAPYQERRETHHVKH